VKELEVKARLDESKSEFKALELPK